MLMTNTKDNILNWLYKKFKLFLYASDTQTPEAQKTWDKMEAIGWVGNNRKGKYLKTGI